MTRPVANRPTTSIVTSSQSSAKSTQPKSADLGAVNSSRKDKPGFKKTGSQASLPGVNGWQSAKASGMVRAQSLPTLGRKHAMHDARPELASDAGKYPATHAAKALQTAMAHDLSNPFADSADSYHVNMRRQAQGNSSMSTSSALPNLKAFVTARPSTVASPKGATMVGRPRLRREPAISSGESNESLVRKAMEGMHSVSQEARAISRRPGKPKKTVTTAARSLGKAAGVVSTEAQKQLRAMLPASLAERRSDAQIKRLYKDIKERSAESNERLRKALGESLSALGSEVEPALYLSGFAIGRQYALDGGGRAERKLGEVMLERLGMLPGGAKLIAEHDPLKKGYHFTVDHVIELAALLPDDHVRAQALSFFEGARQGLRGPDIAMPASIETGEL